MLPRFFNEPRYARSARQSGAQFSRSISGLVKMALRPATQPKRRRALERNRTELLKEIQNRNFDNMHFGWCRTIWNCVMGKPTTRHEELD